MDIHLNILSDISNFALVIFGFCATLYTVIYSFVLNKKDILDEMSELLKHGEKVSLHTLKERKLVIYINRMRRFNSYIILCLWSSIIIYVTALIIKYFELYDLSVNLFDRIINGCLVYILLGLTMILFFAIVILINRSIITYNRTTKI